MKPKKAQQAEIKAPMTSKELDYIIQEGEGYLVEFKERVNASLAREITAFANASGGRIFLSASLTTAPLSV
jgi:predicted HTH transcriptional regulator